MFLSSLDYATTSLLSQNSTKVDIVRGTTPTPDLNGAWKEEIANWFHIDVVFHD